MTPRPASHRAAAAPRLSDGRFAAPTTEPRPARDDPAAAQERVIEWLRHFNRRSAERRR